jgi:hypothetical protein
MSHDDADHRAKMVREWGYRPRDFSDDRVTALAEAMHRIKPEGPEGTAQWAMTVEHLVEMFQRDNSRFKPNRFRAACNDGRTN